MKKSATILAVISVMAAISSTAQAQNWRERPFPPAGHTLVNLSATERQQVAQDTLTADLRYEFEGNDAKTVQATINKAMKQAVDKAKTVKGVTVTTGSYQIYNYDPEPQPNGVFRKGKQRWRGSQSIILETKDAPPLLDLTGAIQEMGFAMNGLNYSLSVQKAEGYRDQLLERALATLKTRAALMAKSLGKSGYDLMEVQVDSVNGPIAYAPKMMRMEMSAAADTAAAPVAEAGQSEVQLTVNASVLLKP